MERWHRGRRRPRADPRAGRRARRCGRGQRRNRNRHRQQQVRGSAGRGRAKPRPGHREGDCGVRAGRRHGGPPPGPGVSGGGDQRGRRRSAMIRLGSLAGYSFEGPRLLGGWTPPQAAAVYAILCKPEPEAKPEKYAVIYVGHSDDLSAERFPFRHSHAASWVRRAGSKWKVYICTFEVPGGTRPHREQIARELTSIYRPSCNGQQYDPSGKDEWIGESSPPTTEPVSRRGPDQA